MPVSSSRPALLGATILLGAVFTFSAWCVRDYARDVLRQPYAISAIFPQNARSRRVVERSGARAAGQMEVVGLAWDRYVWPLATSGAARLQPASTK